MIFEEIFATRFEVWGGLGQARASLATQAGRSLNRPRIVEFSKNNRLILLRISLMKESSRRARVRGDDE